MSDTPETSHAVLDDPRRGIPWWVYVGVVFAIVAGLAVFLSTPDGQEEVFLHQLIIRIDPNVPGDRERALAKAERVRQELLTPGTDFTVVAFHEGESYWAKTERPGVVGWIGRGVVPPAVEEVAFALAVEEISEIVEEPRSFRILMVSDRRGFQD